MTIDKVDGLNHFADLFNNLSFDFWAVDRNRTYIFQNRNSCNTWGNVIGLSIDELGIEESIRKIWHSQLESVFAGKIINTEYQDADSDRWFKTIISPVMQQSSVTAAVGVTLDITEIKENEKKLVEKSLDLESMNRTLQVMVKNQDDIRSSIEHEISSIIRRTSLPLLSRLKHHCEGLPECSPLLNALEQSLTSIHPSTMASSYKAKLSATEIQVVNLIEQEKTSKEIADLLNIAKSTVDTHRDKIRDKLELKSQRVSLKKFILNELQKITT